MRALSPVESMGVNSRSLGQCFSVSGTPMKTFVEPGKARTPAGARQGLSSQAGSRRGHVPAGKAGQWYVEG